MRENSSKHHYMVFNNSEGTISNNISFDQQNIIQNSILILLQQKVGEISTKLHCAVRNIKTPKYKRKCLNESSI